MSRMEAIRNMVSERRVGFLVDEVMTGTHEFAEGKGPKGTFPMEFRVTWGNKHITNFANPLNDEFFKTDLYGKVDIGGLVTDADCEGTLELNYLKDASIVYTFDFQDDQGKRYHYVGEKRDIRPWNLHRTHTTCYGTLADAETGELISESITYFRLSTMLPFLLSMRLG